MAPLPVRYESLNASLEFRRPAEGVVLAIFEGHDVGELGRAPFDELAKDIAEGPFELFVDARRSAGASIDVSAEWSQWLAKNKGHLRRMHMLTCSRFIQLTAELVRRVSELGDKMRIYTEPGAFDEAVNAATASRRVYVDDHR